MELNADLCYRAILSRDRRFDGRFFTGIVTTGVYCRPICPVRPAKFENMRFFACASAAQDAGFRPCLRCRPEASPYTPSWAETSETVSRALQLISQGALDEAGVDDLGHRLGVTSRHLRRLFAEHLGSSPGAIARNRRVHFAKKLLDETSLAIIEVAFSAGFGSVREFNYAVRATFGLSPGELRRRGRGPAVERDEGLTIRLAYRPPFDWCTLVRFLMPRATPGVEVVDESAYRRVIELHGATGVIDVRPAAGAECLLLSVTLPSYEGLIQVVERVRRLFDLDADPLSIADGLARDRRLVPLIAERPGVRVPGAWDGFELAVRAILGQQFTVRGATVLAGRLVRQFGKRVDADEQRGLTHLFPPADVLARADLAEIGITRARAEAIKCLASSVVHGDLLLDSPLGLDDAIGRLRDLPGIGDWTAQYIAMRALGEPDAFPASDLGLRRAVARGFKSVSARELLQVAESWRPWRSYAAMYLWTRPPPRGAP